MKNRLDEVTRMKQLAGISTKDIAFSVDSSINMEKVIYESVARKSTKPFDTVMTYHVVPRVVNEIKKDIIRTLGTNDYFTIEERIVLCEYFEVHNNLLKENVDKYTETLDEAFKDWWKSGKEKLASVFGSVKDYVSKIWAKIKEVFKKIIDKASQFVKPIVEKLKGKVKPHLEKIVNDPKLKHELVGETIDLGKIVLYVREKAGSLLDSLDTKVIQPATQAVEKGQEADSAGAEKGEVKEGLKNKFKRESFEFTGITTRYIVENVNKNNLFLVEEEEKAGEEKSSWPAFLTAKGWKDNWKKYLFNIFKMVLNPVMGTIGVVGSYVGEGALNQISKVVAKLGGPPARKFHVLPEMVFAGMEVAGMYGPAWDKFLEVIKPTLELIPFGIGEILIHFWEFGHAALFYYAIYELVKETLDSMGVDLKKIGSDVASGLSRGATAAAGPK